MIARAIVSSAAEIHPTSIVSPDAELGRGVTIGALCMIHANVSVGDGSFVDSHSVLGAPTADYYSSPRTYEPAPCRIGRQAVIRSHAIVYSGVTIGDGFECGHHVTLRERTQVGDGVRLGTLCDIQPEVSIGSYARLHSDVFIAKGSTIEEITWLFPGVVLIDDPHPPSDTCTQGATVRKFAVVGAQSMLNPGVEIGEGAVVGAMSFVRHDVPNDSVVVGVPARVVGATADIQCHEGRLGQVYPWWRHFRRGYPEGVLPDPDA
jgi:acetyltransferase-like isoleucine patch superfamily enzyme